MKVEGLFRVPGPAAYTDELRKGFEEGTHLCGTEAKLSFYRFHSIFLSQGVTLSPTASARLTLLQWPVC